MMMLQTDWIDFFFTTGILGYLGPLALIVAGLIISNKYKGTGILFFIVYGLLIVQYADLLAATPDYIWQIFLLWIGVLLLIPTMIRK